MANKSQSFLLVLLLVAVGLLQLFVGQVQSNQNPNWNPNWRPYKNDSFVIPEVDPKAAEKFYAGASRFGLPSTDNLKISENYMLSYDRRLKHPIWVLEHLTDKQMKSRRGDRNLSWFQPDKTLHPYFRSTNDDYMGSGFDRGHMSPASDNMYSQRIMDQSFCLSNTAPQLPGLNRGAWVRLERYVQHLAAHTKDIYVVTGSLYLPVQNAHGDWVVRYKVVGPNRVSAPTHFYKVWVREDYDGRLYMESFLIPNSPEITKESTLEQFRVDISQLPRLERAGGVIFFDRLDRSRVIKPTTLQMGYVDEKILFKSDTQSNSSG